MPCVAFRVKGRVQGVFFRKHTLHKAHELGLKGWVRNRDDGDVEGVACGEESVLQQFQNWLWHGSPVSRVDDIQLSPEPLQFFDDFTIEH